MKVRILNEREKLTNSETKQQMCDSENPQYSVGSLVCRLIGSGAPNKRHTRDPSENLRKIRAKDGRLLWQPHTDVLFSVSTASHDWLSDAYKETCRGVISQHWLMQLSSPVRLATEKNQTPLSGYAHISDVAHSHIAFVYIMISHWLNIQSLNSDAPHALNAKRGLSLFNSAKYCTFDRLKRLKWTPFMFLLFVLTKWKKFV